MEREMGRSKRAARAAQAQQQQRADGIYNTITGMGGAYDKSTASRPSTSINPLTDQELRAAYLYNGLPRRIVDILPQKATRKGWSAPEIPQKEEDRLRVWDRVCEGMTMGRLYGGAVGLLVTEDDIPPSFRARPDLWLQEPLDLERVGKLHAIHTFDAWDARPYSFNENLRSVDFRAPSVWSLATGRRDLLVHTSRLVWWRGARRPTSELRGGWRRTNAMPDDSVLQTIWEDLARLLTVAQAGAILAGEIREAIVKIAGLGALNASDQKEAFDARMRAMMQSRSILGLTVLAATDSFETRSNNPEGWDNLHEGALTLLCAVLGWPRTMLTGEAPGGLSTDDYSGLERERQLVSEYQERHRPEITRIYEVLYASQDGPTSGQIPEEWGITFAPLNEPTDAETAALRHQVAQTDQLYVDMGVYTAAEIAKQRFGEGGWSLELEAVAVVAPAPAPVAPPVPIEGGNVSIPDLDPEPEADPETEESPLA
jgi:phage-related protein (TIGR01555 family)